MPYSDQIHHLRIELDTKNFSLSAAQVEKMERELDPLRAPVRRFPVSDLYVTISYRRASGDFHAHTALVLPGQTLATGDHEMDPLSAFGRCVRKLVNKVVAYKQKLDGKPQRDKAREGTAHEVVPSQEPDAELLRRAVDDGDYLTFREAMFRYEESVWERVGRWVQRYPELEARLGRTVSIEDLVEEVFLNAFEQFDRRPASLRLGNWLEELIDPSAKALLAAPEAEQENISVVRTLREI